MRTPSCIEIRSSISLMWLLTLNLIRYHSYRHSYLNTMYLLDLKPLPVLLWCIVLLAGHCQPPLKPRPFQRIAVQAGVIYVKIHLNYKYGQLIIQKSFYDVFVMHISSRCLQSDHNTVYRAMDGKTDLKSLYIVVSAA